MPYHNVTFKCGHTKSIRLSGRCADRDRYVDYLEATSICYDCERANKRKAKYERAVSLSESLPKLEGSEKQVAWAMSIRQDWIDDAKERLDNDEEKYKECVKIAMDELNENDKILSSEEYKHGDHFGLRVMAAHHETSAKHFIEAFKYVDFTSPIGLLRATLGKTGPILGKGWLG